MSFREMFLDAMREAEDPGNPLLSRLARQELGAMALLALRELLTE